MIRSELETASSCVDLDLLAACKPRGNVLDVGTGTAQIPIEFCRQSREGRVVAISAGNNTPVSGSNPLLLEPLTNTGFNSNGQLAPGAGLTPALPAPFAHHRHMEFEPVK